jgi:hypothetical protein
MFFSCRIKTNRAIAPPNQRCTPIGLSIRKPTAAVPRPAMLAREMIRRYKNATVNPSIPIAAETGERKRRTPNVVATPFPPRKFKNGEKQCPKTTAKAAPQVVVTWMESWLDSIELSRFKMIWSPLGVAKKTASIPFPKSRTRVRNPAGQNAAPLALNIRPNMRPKGIDPKKKAISQRIGTQDRVKKPISNRISLKLFS